MRNPFKFALAAGAMIALAGTFAQADTVAVGVGVQVGVINGIRDGKLSLTLKATGVEKLIGLEDVAGLGVDLVPAFAEAEAARADVLKAVPAYRALVAGVNKPALKVVAQWRAIEPLERAGQWSEAVGMFLEVYAASPAEGVWKVRPQRYPAAGSKMLAEAADKVAAAVKSAKSDETRMNLKGWLLEIYTKAGDTVAAERVARDLDTGGQVPVVRAAEPAAAAVGLKDIEAAMRVKDYDGAIRKADGVLKTATGTTAVQAFALKAQALEGLGKDEEAAGVWLRIVAHYPDSVRAAEAMLRAAELEKKLNRAEAVAALLQGVVNDYPASREAGVAKGMLGP